MAPLSTAKCEGLKCVLPLHNSAFSDKHSNTFTCALFLFACCLIQRFAVICILSNTHLIIDVPLLCPLPSLYQRHGRPCLSDQFTLVGRQCSRAVTNETHSSIPLFLTWYHMHTRQAVLAGVPNLVPNMGTGDTLSPDTMGSSRFTTVHCSYPVATLTREDDGVVGSKEAPMSIFGRTCDFPFLV